LIFWSTTSYLHLIVTTARTRKKCQAVPFRKPALALTADQKKEVEHAKLTDFGCNSCVQLPFKRVGTKEGEGPIRLRLLLDAHTGKLSAIAAGQCYRAAATEWSNAERVVAGLGFVHSVSGFHG
jgi:hypothetical protein